MDSSDELKKGYVHIFSAMRRMKKRRFDKLLTAKMSIAEYMMLGAIYTGKKSNGEKKLYVSDIAEMLAISTQGVSKALRVLEERNFIERFVDTSDRRNTEVRLTKYGEKAFLDSEKNVIKFHDEIKAEFNPDELNNALAVMRKFENRIDEKLDEL